MLKNDYNVFNCLSNVIKTNKKLLKIFTLFGSQFEGGWGGGGQEGQRSHFPPFIFLNPSLTHTVYAKTRIINRQIVPLGLIIPVTPQWPLFGGSHCDQSGSYRPEEDNCEEHPADIQGDGIGLKSQHCRRGPDRAPAP